MTCKKLYILFFLFAILVSCNEDVEQQAQLDMTLCLPANEIVHRAGGPRRVIGDPGEAEQFELPKYAYVFVMKNEGPGTEWEIWKSEKLELNIAQWVKKRYNGSWDTRHDSIFSYRERIVFPLHKDRPMGRVYAICSNMDLTFDNNSLSSLSDMEDVLDLKFNTAPDSIQQHLQNIYSTPYNYAPTGEYYCSFDCSTGFSYHVDLLLYHVAAKVDIKWNVVDSVRINKDDPDAAVRLTYMEARRLFNGYAYCFKPMKNELGSLPGAGYGYTIADIVTPTDEGLWWEGRSYFYTIPYYVDGDAYHFPLQMRMGTNGATKANAGYELTLKQMIDTTAVFVPWLRGDFKLTKPLENKAETKEVS